MDFFKINVQNLPIAVKLLLEQLANERKIPAFQHTTDNIRDRPWFAIGLLHKIEWTYATGDSIVAANHIKWPILTLDEAIRRLANKPKLITIGGYNVTNIDEIGFKVGCTDVTWKQFDEIAELRPKSKS